MKQVLHQDFLNTFRIPFFKIIGFFSRTQDIPFLRYVKQLITYCIIAFFELTALLGLCTLRWSKKGNNYIDNLNRGWMLT